MTRKGTCSNCLFSRNSGHETNEELTARLMRFAKSGPMMQLFILTAIHKYAEQCVKAGAATFDTAFLSGAAWVLCAKEALENIDRHLALPHSPDAPDPT
jgi:hypothetical protein